uniref:Putative secreted protein n=1 Tax=Anopheles darlingi TaxID=43151 RepID=A0A2M4DBU1_ANODA
MARVALLTTGAALPMHHERTAAVPSLRLPPSTRMLISPSTITTCSPNAPMAMSVSARCLTVYYCHRLLSTPTPLIRVV